MGPRRCRLCSTFTTEGSIFCELHQQQAAQFARAVGASAPVTPVAPAVGALELPAPEPARAATEPASRGDTALEQAVRAAWDRIREAEPRERSRRRWPQISVYFLDDRLIARPYYSIVPAQDGAAAELAPLAVDSEAVRRALAPDSPVMSALERSFSERAAALKARVLQSLDLHIVTYARLIAISENPGGREPVVAAFDLAGDEVTPASIAELRPRLRHDRW